MNAVSDIALLPAWVDRVHDAQASFRCILKALSEPGTVQTLPVEIDGPEPLETAAVALCLTLADFETPLWMSEATRTPAVESYLRFHCGCPIVNDPAAAAFALITDPREDLSLARFAQGSLAYPDRSATLVIQVPTLERGPERKLSGPGIAGSSTLRVGGLPENFDAIWKENAASFPLGVDIIFCCANAIVALARTTQIHV